MTAPLPPPPGLPLPTPPEPGPPPAGRVGRPSLEAAWIGEYRLILRSVCTPGRLIAVTALSLLSVLSGTLTATAGNGGYRDAVGFVNGNVATLVPVAVLIFGAAALGDLLEDGSLVYLWLRPIPAWVHVLAAWAATITVVIPLVLVPVVATAAFIDASPEIITSSILAGLIAVVAYAALFVTGGIRFKRAVAWGLAYLLIWEGFIASAGQTATRLAIRSYVRSILSQQTGVSLKLADFTLASGIIVPLAVAALVLTYATRRLAKTDVA
jgi:ABC-2 type transport system permease protein